MLIATLLVESLEGSRLSTPGALVFLIPAASSFVVGLFDTADGTVIYHDEDTAGTVTVQQYPDGKRVLRVNGAGMGL